MNSKSEPTGGRRSQSPSNAQLETFMFPHLPSGHGGVLSVSRHYNLYPEQSTDACGCQAPDGILSYTDPLYPAG